MNHRLLAHVIDRHVADVESPLIVELLQHLSVILVNYAEAERIEKLQEAIRIENRTRSRGVPAPVPPPPPPPKT